MLSYTNCARDALFDALPATIAKLRSFSRDFSTSESFPIPRIDLDRLRVRIKLCDDNSYPLIYACNRIDTCFDFRNYRDVVTCTDHEAIGIAWEQCPTPTKATAALRGASSLERFKELLHAKSCTINTINTEGPLTDHQATVVARGLCPAVTSATLMSHLVAPPENVEKLWDVAVACWRENPFCSHERRVCLPDAPETAMGLGLHAFIIPEVQVKFDPENIQVGDLNNNIKSFTNPTLAFGHVKKLLDPSRETMRHADASIPERANLFHTVPRVWALDIERSMRRTRALKHELIRATWHPSRFFEWCLPIDEQCELLIL